MPGTSYVVWFGGDNQGQPQSKGAQEKKKAGPRLKRTRPLGEAGGDSGDDDEADFDDEAAPSSISGSCGVVKEEKEEKRSRALPFFGGKKPKGPSVIARDALKAAGGSGSGASSLSGKPPAARATAKPKFALYIPSYTKK